MQPATARATNRDHRAPSGAQCGNNLLTVRTVPKGRSVEIWLYRGERPIHRQASLKKAFVADAERYGQHLLDNAGDDALRCIERCVRTRPSQPKARSRGLRLD